MSRKQHQQLGQQPAGGATTNRRKKNQIDYQQMHNGAPLAAAADQQQQQPNSQAAGQLRAPFELDVSDMERHSVELRLALDKARRRFLKAQMGYKFEQIIETILESTQEEEKRRGQLNAIQLATINEDQTRRLSKFLDCCVDMCQQQEQHEQLQSALRATLQNSRRRSILVASENAPAEAKLEPFCLFCASDLNSSCALGQLPAVSGGCIGHCDPNNQRGGGAPDGAAAATNLIGGTTPPLSYIGATPPFQSISSQSTGASQQQQHELVRAEPLDGATGNNQNGGRHLAIAQIQLVHEAVTPPPSTAPTPETAGGAPWCEYVPRVNGAGGRQTRARPGARSNNNNKQPNASEATSDDARRKQQQQRDSVVPPSPDTSFNEEEEEEAADSSGRADSIQSVLDQLSASGILRRSSTPLTDSQPSQSNLVIDESARAELSQSILAPAGGSGGGGGSSSSNTNGTGRPKATPSSRGDKIEQVSAKLKEVQQQQQRRSSVQPQPQPQPQTPPVASSSNAGAQQSAGAAPTSQGPKMKRRPKRQRETSKQLKRSN